MARRRRVDPSHQSSEMPHSIFNRGLDREDPHFPRVLRMTSSWARGRGDAQKWQSKVSTITFRALQARIHKWQETQQVSSAKFQYLKKQGLGKRTLKPTWNLSLTRVQDST